MATVTPTSIPRGPIGLAAHLHVPDDVQDRRPRPAVVISTPGSGVKEQIGANHASRRADRGLVAVAFDPAFQGESGGEPRDLEDPAERVPDPRWADHRVRALGLVVPSDIGCAFRAMTAATPGGVHEALPTRGGTPNATDGEALARIPGSPEEARATGITDIDVLQAVDYYRTPQWAHPRSTNRRHPGSDARIYGFDAFAPVEELLTRPVHGIVAESGSTGSRADGERIARLAPAAQDVLVVESARHYEMYDQPRYVDHAVDRLAGFFGAHLE